MSGAKAPVHFSHILQKDCFLVFRLVERHGAILYRTQGVIQDCMLGGGEQRPNHGSLGGSGGQRI